MVKNYEIVSTYYLPKNRGSSTTIPRRHLGCLRRCYRFRTCRRVYGNGARSSTDSWSSSRRRRCPMPRTTGSTGSRRRPRMRNDAHRRTHTCWGPCCNCRSGCRGTRAVRQARRGSGSSLWSAVSRRDWWVGARTGRNWHRFRRRPRPRSWWSLLLCRRYPSRSSCPVFFCTPRRPVEELWTKLGRGWVWQSSDLGSILYLYLLQTSLRTDQQHVSKLWNN